MKFLTNLHIHRLHVGAASTDKLRPRSLRSGLSALGSGGRRFEEGSHIFAYKDVCFLLFAYLKNNKIIFKKWCSMKAFK